MNKDLMAQQHHPLIAELRNLGVQLGMASSHEGEQRIERLVLGYSHGSFMLLLLATT